MKICYKRKKHHEPNGRFSAYNQACMNNDFRFVKFICRPTLFISLLKCVQLKFKSL